MFCKAVLDDKSTRAMFSDVDVTGLPMSVKFVPSKLYANCEVTPGVA